MGTATRLSSDERREQLLAVASDLVAERGVGAVTMEGLASKAGVSKALPYKHFDNAEAVLVELHRREMANMGAAVLTAVEGATTPADKVSAAVRSYFDVVVQRGAVLAALSGAGSEIPQLSGVGERVGTTFLSGLFIREFGCPPAKARVAAALLLGALLGAVEALAYGEASRRRLEEASVSLARHLLEEARGA